jgi:hypothetical protein
MNTTGGGQFDKHKGTYVTDMERGHDLHDDLGVGFMSTTINSTNYEHPNFRGASTMVTPPQLKPNTDADYDRFTKIYHPEDHIRDKDGVANVQESLFGIKPPIISSMGTTHRLSPDVGRSLSTALAESKKRYNMKPWASGNTSEFSTPLADKAVAAGILGGIEGKRSKDSAEKGNEEGLEYGKQAAQIGAYNVKLGLSKRTGVKQKRVSNREVDKNTTELKNKIGNRDKYQNTPTKKPKKKKNTYVQDTLDFGDEK